MLSSSVLQEADPAYYSQRIDGFGPLHETYANIRSTFPAPVNGSSLGRAVSVLAHGYPAWLLAEGFEEVASFDTSDEAILWGKLVRASVEMLDYEQALSFFRHNLDGSPPDHPDLRSTAETDLAQKAFAATPFDTEEDEYITRGLYNHYLCESALSLYDAPRFTDDNEDFSEPFFSDENRYNTIATAVRAGGWSIEQADIRVFLEGRAAEEPDSYNFAYLSNIRHWDAMQREGIITIGRGGPLQVRPAQWHANDMHERISATINDLIVPGGTVYEAQLAPDGTDYLLPLDLDCTDWEVTARTGHRNPAEAQPLDLQDIDLLELPKILHYTRTS